MTPGQYQRRSMPRDPDSARNVGEGSTFDPSSTSAISTSTASRLSLSNSRQASASGTSTSGSRFGRRIRPGDGYPTSTES
ncbi:unnamed protein product, partial [Strongylus vulgaris]